MFKAVSLLLFLMLVVCLRLLAQKPADYNDYHRQMIQADQQIVAGRYKEALLLMDRVFGQYSYVFLRDYQVATQLAVFTGNRSKAFQYLKAGAADGWDLAEIKRIKIIQKLQSDPAWWPFVQQYPELHRRYLQTLDMPMRKKIKQMFQDDQRLAVESLQITNETQQDVFLMHKFVPQSERQMRQLYQLLVQKGFPGEKRIGNASWAQVVLSHHNSISPVYVKQDKLYPALRPLLLKAISSGDLSPGDFAIIEDWRIDVGSDHKQSSYGYIHTLKISDLPKSDQLRGAIGLPSVTLRNQLVNVQQRTGITFYLEGTTWVKGKMPVQKN